MKEKRPQCDQIRRFFSFLSLFRVLFMHRWLPLKINWNESAKVWITFAGRLGIIGFLRVTLGWNRSDRIWLRTTPIPISAGAKVLRRRLCWKIDLLFVWYQDTQSVWMMIYTHSKLQNTYTRTIIVFDDLYLLMSH